MIDPDRLLAELEAVRGFCLALERLCDSCETLVEMFVLRCQLAHEREDEKPSE